MVNRLLVFSRFYLYNTQLILLFLVILLIILSLRTKYSTKHGAKYSISHARSFLPPQASLANISKFALENLRRM